MRSVRKEESKKTSKDFGISSWKGSYYVLRVRKTKDGREIGSSVWDPRSLRY